MFDEPTQPNTNEPEDILAPTESSEPRVPSSSAPLEIKSALAGQKLQPITPLSSEQNFTGEEAPFEPEVEITPPMMSKKGLFTTIGIIIVGVVAVGTFYVLKSTSQKAAVVNQQPSVPAVVPVTTAPANIPLPETAPVVTPTPQPAELIGQQTPTTTPVVATTTSAVSTLDSDGDGLTDVQEARLGTDTHKKDTDGDGLTDYEEVMIWHTNPLNPDTDGDGFSDGQEVKNGYNPLGAGKLLQVPTSTVK